MIENINLNGATVTAELHGYMYDGLYKYHGVFDFGNKISHTVVSNNEITLADGLLCNQGRFMRILGSESITIDNGKSGVTRVDLIVAHFETDGVNETHDIRVLKGDSTGAVPTHSSDDIYNGGTASDLVLKKVTLNGLSIESVEDMFDLITPIANFYENIINPNLIINGDFKIWSDKTSYENVSNRKAADRWVIANANGTTKIVEKSKIVPNRPELATSIHISESNSGNTYLRQYLSDKYEGNLTLSFWYKTTVAFNTYAYDSGSHVYLGKNEVLNEWTRAEYSFNATALEQINIIQAMDIGECYITGVKLERGEKATEFVPRLSEEEKALCSGIHEELVNKVVQGDKTTNNYIKFCQMKITSSYINTPFKIELMQRASGAGELAIEFKSVTTTDPDLNIFTSRGWAGCVAPSAYIVKSAESTWDLYVKKIISYDYVTIHKLVKSPHTSFGVTFTWMDEETETLPAGYIEATKEPSMVVMTESEYKALSSKDSNTIYFLTE